MKKIFVRVSLGVIALLLVAITGFIIWAQTPYQPGQQALAALQSGSLVEVIDHGEYIAFAPAGRIPTTAFLFYPGGRVDYRAYAPILRGIAAEGYLVILLQVNLNLAFFDIEAGAPVLQAYPGIEHWITGGHSLGGVAAAYFAAGHPEIEGIVFWASYPADDRLLNTDIRMLSIYGSEDGTLNNGAEIEQYKANQPADTEFVVIQGGNHAQFGDYGAQEGDNPATIPAESQWQQTVEATAGFLAAFDN